MCRAVNCLLGWAVLTTVSAATVAAQEVRNSPPGVGIMRGIEPTQNIAYVRMFLEGRLMLPAKSPDASTLQQSESAPVLIAQCTRAANGKFRFELMMNFGGIADKSFHPPWKSKGSDDPFPPPVQKISMTFDFFGYTRVKPVKRQWDVILEPYGEYRYTPPSGGSRNLEEVTFYLQYLKALPTLRVTGDARAAQFETTPLLAAMHSEPLCWASGV